MELSEKTIRLCVDAIKKSDKKVREILPPEDEKDLTGLIYYGLLDLYKYSLAELETYRNEHCPMEE